MITITFFHFTPYALLKHTPLPFLMSKVRVKRHLNPEARTILKIEVKWRRKTWIYDNDFNGSTWSINNEEHLKVYAASPLPAPYYFSNCSICHLSVSLVTSHDVINVVTIRHTMSHMTR